MTVKEFYEYMVKQGAENYEMGNYYYNGYGEYKEDYWEIDHENKKVTTDFEC